MRLVLIVGLSIVCLATPAFSQERRDDIPQAGQVDDVVVSGRRLDDLVRRFVGEVAAPARANRGLARWRGSVCVGTINFRAQVAQYLIDRVSDEARELGVPAGEPGCKANVLIVGTTDGAATMDSWVEARPGVFFTGIGAMSQSRAALLQVRASDAPVRWWQVSVPVDIDSGKIAIRWPGELSYPVIAVRSASRLRSQITDNLMRVVVVVDVDRAQSASLSQLSDYVSFVALAQVDPEADTANFDTILNLFDTPSPDRGLTDWDRSYLTALYGQHATYALPGQQMREMSRVIEADQRQQRAEPQP
jgi:hypothetical protein